MQSDKSLTHLTCFGKLVHSRSSLQGNGVMPQHLLATNMVKE